MDIAIAKSAKLFQKKWIWPVVGLFAAMIIAIAISNEEWTYLGLLLAPVFVYLSIEQPFIFPFGVYAALLPFDSVLSLTGRSGGATLTKLLGVLAILVLVFKGAFENKLRFPDKAALFWVLFVVYSISSALWAIDTSHTLSVLSTCIGLLVLYLVASSYRITEREFTTFKWLVLVGGFFAALLGIYGYQSGLFYGHSERATLTMGEGATDPNRFAFVLLLPNAVCIELLLNHKKIMVKVFLSIVLAVLLCSVVITGSRGGMLGVMAIFAVYVLSSRKKIALWILITIILSILVSMTPVYFLDRWGKAIETGGTGRLEIWEVGLSALKQYWAFGAGLNNFPDVYNQFYTHFTPFSLLGRAAHNIYLLTFVELGIIGIFLFILGMLRHYKIVKSRFILYDNNRIMLKAAFWGIIISSCFLDTMWTKSFWLLWMMIMMHRNSIETGIMR